MPSTLYEKLWQRHLVEDKSGETPLIFVDRHLALFKNDEWYRAPVY